jgi:hypothetical protein
MEEVRSLKLQFALQPYCFTPSHHAHVPDIS